MRVAVVLVVCAFVVAIDGAPLPEDAQVKANAKFATHAIENIHAVQADLNAMKKDEQKEITDSKSIQTEVKAVPDAAPGKFDQEEQALYKQANLMEANADKGVHLEELQQKAALDALAKSKKLIKNFAIAGVSAKEQQLGEAIKTPAVIAQQARAAKAALSNIKEVSSALSTGTQTSHTKEIFNAVGREATQLKSEASASAELGETLDNASPLSVDAAKANFNAAMSAVTAASAAGIAKQNAKVAADKAAVAEATKPVDHKKLLAKETAQLTDIMKKTRTATANEKAAVAEVSSLWKKLN